MKKSDIPQDPSALDNHTRDVIYALDESGKYTTGLSRGWEVKSTALDVAWNDISQRVKDAREAVMSGKASPILFFMELKLMDLSILSAYTGFWTWKVKRHLKPGVFNKLPEKKLKKYAELFEITIEQLKNPNLHADQL